MGLLLLVRHGQASFGTDDYDVLSDTGWTQGRLLGAWLAERGVVPTSLVRGSMRRHRETLEAMLDGAGRAWSGVPDPAVDAAWDEFDHLAVIAAHPEAPQGPVDRREFQRVFEVATAAWAADEGPAAGDHESYGDFLARCRGALDRAVEQAGSGRTVVAVTSGGPIAVAAATLTDPEGTDRAAVARAWARFNTVVVNAATTRVLVGPSGARLLTFNEHPHLEGDRLTYR